jgi:hypothetical protein
VSTSADRPGRPVTRRLAIAATAVLGAGAATAAAVLGAGTASAGSVPAAGSWHIVKTTHRSGNPVFTAITASSRTNGWAFLGEQTGTSRPLAYRLTGSGWHQTAFPNETGETVTAAVATSASNAFVLLTGKKNRVLRWNGHSWRKIRTIGRTMTGLSASGRKNAWVFGARQAWHWNGDHWTAVSVGKPLSAGYTRSPRSVWAVGGSNVVHYNGHIWRVTSVAKLLPATTTLSKSRLVAIWVYSPRSVWAVATGGREDEGGVAVVLHYNGHTWSRKALGKTDGTPEAVIPDPAGGLWIPAQLGDGGAFQMLRYNNGSLKTVAVPHGGYGIEAPAVSTVPGTHASLAAGFTHRAHNLGGRIRGAIIKFTS